VAPLGKGSWVRRDDVRGLQVSITLGNTAPKHLGGEGACPKIHSQNSSFPKEMNDSKICLRQ